MCVQGEGERAERETKDMLSKVRSINKEDGKERKSGERDVKRRGRN